MDRPPLEAASGNDPGYERLARARLLGGPCDHAQPVLCRELFQAEQCRGRGHSSKCARAPRPARLQLLQPHRREVAVVAENPVAPPCRGTGKSLRRRESLIEDDGEYRGRLHRRYRAGESCGGSGACQHEVTPVHDDPSARIQRAIARASAMLMRSLATMGIVPQLPAPPLMILSARRFTAASRSVA